MMLNIWNVSKAFIDSGNNIVRKGLQEVFRRVQASNLFPIQGPLESYNGADITVFKFFDARIFQEELRGINPMATPGYSSEK